MRSATGVRVGLVGIGVTLATLFVAAEVRSQPGYRPGFPSGPPRPPVIPSIPRPPTPPPPPTFTTPPGGGIGGGIAGGISGMPNRPGFGGPPSGRLFETVWTCSGCRTELGRGDTRPGHTHCPNCGVRFINGGGGVGGFGGRTDPGPFMSRGTPPSQTPPPSTPAPPAQGSFQQPGGGADPTPNLTQFFGPAPTQPAPAEAPPPEAPSESGTVLGKLLVALLILLGLLAGAGGVLMLVSANQPKARQRRRRDWDDDYDD